MFPDKNFSKVVPRVLSSGDHDALVMLAPSVVLTNLPSNTSEEQAAEVAKEASQQMVKIAIEALKEHPNLKKAVVMESAPRFDKWKATNEFANEELHEALKNETDEEVKQKVFIGRQTLECDNGLMLSRYGDPARRQVDGIHLKGSSGMIALTRSIAGIFAGAGFTTHSLAQGCGRWEGPDASCSSSSPSSSSAIPSSGFQTQGSRGAAPRRQEDTQFQLQTHNQFAPLSN